MQLLEESSRVENFHNPVRTLLVFFKTGAHGFAVVAAASDMSTLDCRPFREGHNRGSCDFTWFQLRTMRYSLRRAMFLDSVDGYTHNPKVGGSNPPPATKFSLKIRCYDGAGKCSPVLFSRMSAFCPCSKNDRHDSGEFGRHITVRLSVTRTCSISLGNPEAKHPA